LNTIAGREEEGRRVMAGREAILRVMLGLCYFRMLHGRFARSGDLINASVCACAFYLHTLWGGTFEKAI